MGNIKSMQRLIQLREGLRPRIPLISDDGLYRHHLIVLPDTAERYGRFMQRKQLDRIHDRDVWGVRFRYIQSSLNAGLTYERMYGSIMETLRNTYRLPMDIYLPGSLRIEVVTPGPSGGERTRSTPDVSDGGFTLGGRASITQNFTRLQDVRWDHILEALGERNYVNFVLEALELNFEFELKPFLAHTMPQRGGACRKRSKPIKPWDYEKYPLYEYKEWNSIRKSRWDAHFIEANDAHLHGLYGVWDIPTPPYPKAVCGIMAFLYGVALKEETTTAAAECETNPTSLYERAVMVARTLDIPTPMALHDFAKLTAVYAKDKQLVIYDKYRKSLRTINGPDFDVNTVEPFKRGELTSEKWHAFMKTRIGVLFDMQTQHFLAIFSLKTFYKTDCKINRQLVHDGSEEVLGLASKRKRLYRGFACPCCDARLVQSGFEIHRCERFECIYCESVFDDKSLFDKHKKMVGEGYPCDSCFTMIPSLICFEDHKLKCKGVIWDKCPFCREEYKMSLTKIHYCKKFKCNRCKQIILEPLVRDPDRKEFYRQIHKCTLKREESRPKKDEDCDFYVFDFESMLIPSKYSLYEGKDAIPVHHHTVNFASGLQLVEKTTAIDRIEASDLKDFWKAVQLKSEQKSTVWFAHNLKGYDGRLLLDHLESTGVAVSTLLLAGGKIMTMTIPHPNGCGNKITFRDSLLHIPAALTKIPAMFGLDTKIIRKGFFPYSFNIPANVNYIGPIPSRGMFDIERFDSKKRKEFEKWYAKQEGKPYDMLKELKAYCNNDVQVLRDGLLAYQKVCMEYGKMDPLHCVTIAQYTYDHYKRFYMPPNTLYYLDNSFYYFARRALHGGKTDVRRFIYHQTAAEKAKGIGLRYIDIQSLYPTVQYNDPLPVGMPTTYLFDENNQPSREELLTFFGFIECDIEPTVYQHHPILCDYQGNKLLAHLKPMKRVVITSVEFKEAILVTKYRCTHVYRIDHYKPSVTLFKQFVQKWLKLKIVSSAPPCDLDNPQKFEEYNDDLFKNVGLRLEKEEFKPNPSLRSLAKLILNSLWGKFGQRKDLVQTSVFSNSEDKRRYALKKSRGIFTEKSSRDFGQYGARLHRYTHPTGFSNKNVAVASFVTAHARLRLWKVLYKLGGRVYYHDTDSVIYYYDPSKPEDNIEEGKFLGDWESETDSAVISDYVALAPKTYAYKYTDSKGEVNNVIKSKGFSINEVTRQWINFDSYKSLLLGEIPSLVVKDMVFKHVTDPKNMMLTFNTLKKLKFNYGKGHLLKRVLHSLPYGYEQFLTEPFDTVNGVHSEHIRTNWNSDQYITHLQLQTLVDAQEDDSLSTEIIPSEVLGEPEHSVEEAEDRTRFIGDRYYTTDPLHVAVDRFVNSHDARVSY